MYQKHVVALVHNGLSGDSNRIKSYFDWLSQEWPDVDFMVMDNSDGTGFDAVKLSTKVNIENVPTILFLERKVFGSPKVLKVIDPANAVTDGNIRDILYDLGIEPDISVDAVVVTSKKRSWKWVWVAIVSLALSGGGYYLYKKYNS